MALICETSFSLTHVKSIVYCNLTRELLYCIVKKKQVLRRFTRGLEI